MKFLTFWKKNETKAALKSPISDLETPLPPVGTSLMLEGIGTIMSTMLWWFIVAVALGQTAEGLWGWGFLGDAFPWFVSCVFLPVAAALAWWKTRQTNAKLVDIHLGLRGERYVAAHLEELRPFGYLVIHDLPSAVTEKDNHFNIDHAIVGPAGVFAVETKTWSKPIGENPKLLLRGEALKRSDRPLHPEQAKAPEQAVHGRRRAAKILKAATGRDFPVAAVLAVPGWWIEESGNTPDLLLLNPKRIGVVLKGRREVLSREEILFVHSQLQAHGRAAMSKV